MLSVETFLNDRGVKMGVNPLVAFVTACERYELEHGKGSCSPRLYLLEPDGLTPIHADAAFHSFAKESFSFTSILSGYVISPGLTDAQTLRLARVASQSVRWKKKGDTMHINVHLDGDPVKFKIKMRTIAENRNGETLQLITNVH